MKSRLNFEPAFFLPQINSSLNLNVVYQPVFKYQFDPFEFPIKVLNVHI